jgi:hypothetical protein
MKTLADKSFTKNVRARRAMLAILIIVAVAQIAFIKSVFDENCLGPLGEENPVCSAIYDYQKYGAH